MSIAFTLAERPAGFLAYSVEKGGTATVLCREQLTSLDGRALAWRLDSLESFLFSKIPGLPPRSLIDSLVVVIGRDLAATAYVNEIQGVATVRTKGPKAAGDPVFVADILEMLSFDLGIEVPYNSYNSGDTILNYWVGSEGNIHWFHATHRAGGGARDSPAYAM